MGGGSRTGLPSLDRLIAHLRLPLPAPPHCAARYIRYIYNRVILENATVRAAALSSLARFGAACPALTPRVVELLKRALHDNDDEVRPPCPPARPPAAAAAADVGGASVSYPDGLLLLGRHADGQRSDTFSGS